VHLRPLSGIHTPTLFASATPEPVRAFLDQKEVGAHVAVMDEKPFQAPGTVRHRLRGRLGDSPVKQLLLAEGHIQRHLAAEGRVYVISRTRDQVANLSRWLERHCDAPIFRLHGDMVDTAEQARRLQRFKGFRPDQTRVAVMAAFRGTAPAILVATNLVGAGTDVAEADLIVITDADGFGEAELEQLVGRVGRRERASEACLVVGTLHRQPRGPARR